MSANRPDHSTLRRIRNLALFSDDQLTSLAANLNIKTAPKGHRILKLGSVGRYKIYLLGGELKCQSSDGNSEVFQSDDSSDLQSIAQVRPSLYDVDALSDVSYLEIYDDQLSEFSQMVEQQGEQYEVSIIEQSEEANRLTIQLCQDMMEGNITLPSMPEVALKIQKAFNDENYDAKTISMLIQSDPSITAKLLKIANSPLYSGDNQIDTLQQAIVRMGMQTIRKQVMIYAASELFREKSAHMKSRMQGLWQHSRKVASLSRILAKKSGRFDPESAQMAGLLSDLGVIAILQYAQEHTDLYDDEFALDQTIRDLRPQINSMLLYKWNFPDELVTVGEESRDWFRNHADNADLCDLVLIARFHSYIGSDSMLDIPALSKMPAFSKLNLPDFGPLDSTKFLEESQSEIAEIESMLGSV